MIHTEQELRKAGRWLRDELEVIDIGVHAAVNAAATGAAVLGPFAIPAAVVVFCKAITRSRTRGIRAAGSATIMRVSDHDITLAPCVFGDGQQAIEVDGLRPWMPNGFQAYIDTALSGTYHMDVFFRGRLTYFVPRDRDFDVTVKLVRQVAILLRPKMERDKLVGHVLAPPSRPSTAG
jgi:hypothetical protein